MSLVVRKLCLYPNGDEEKNGKGYISMSLVIVETNTLPVGWEALVKFKFFVYNYIQDKFLKIQGIIFFVYIFVNIFNKFVIVNKK